MPTLQEVVRLQVPASNIFYFLIAQLRNLCEFIVIVICPINLSFFNLMMYLRYSALSQIFFSSGWFCYLLLSEVIIIYYIPNHIIFYESHSIWLAITPLICITRRSSVCLNSSSGIGWADSCFRFLGFIIVTASSL
jgi:hypothetical protein